MIADCSPSSFREQIVDMSIAREKSLVMNHIRLLTGKWKLNLVRFRKGRSNPQLRYYFAEPVSRFMDFMEEQGQFYTKEEVHDFFKRKFIREPRPVVHPLTGEHVGDIFTTAKMSAAEFSEFIENVRFFMHDSLGIQTQHPDAFRR